MIFIELLHEEKNALYIGCYRDYTQLHHMEHLIAKGQMTPQICFHLCRQEGAAYAGLAAG